MTTTLSPYESYCEICGRRVVPRCGIVNKTCYKCRKDKEKQIKKENYLAREGGKSC